MSDIERPRPLNLTEDEAEYIWEMLKEEVGKESVQYGEDRETVESLHTKVRRIYHDEDTGTDGGEGDE